MIIRLNNDVVAFPDGRFSSNDPDGLLAVGGKLTPEWLLTAYRQGIFPWFNDDEAEALWWCPTQKSGNKTWRDESPEEPEKND